MANQKIHEYILERFSIGDDDYFDIDYFDGTNYTSAKVKGSVIKALASAINIYNTDGTLTADRILDGDGNTLTFDDLRQLEINVNPAPLGTPGVDINVIPSGPLMRVKDATSGDIRFDVLQSGEIRFNNAYQFPLNDGASGEVLTTDGLGNLTFQPAGGGVNIYNSDGTLTADRTLTGNNFVLFFQTLGSFIVHSHKNNIDNVVFEVRTQSGYDSFTIRDHNTGDNLFTINNGTIQILNEYLLPSVDGTNGQVIVTDGVGNTSFQDAPNIYNNDGTLNGLRTLSGNQENLLFDNLGLFYVKINPPILQDWGVNVRVDTTNLTPGSDGTPFRVMRDQDNKILFASVEDGRVNVNEAYYLPSSAGALGEVLTSAGGSVVNWQSILSSIPYLPPIIPLFSFGTQGATFLANGNGAGGQYYFSATANNSILTQVSLDNAGKTYDASNLKLRIHWQLFSTVPLVTDTVIWRVTYVYITNVDDADSKVATVVQNTISVGTRLPNRLYTDDLNVMPGVANAKLLNISVARLGNTDTYPNTADLFGIELIKV